MRSNIQDLEQQTRSIWQRGLDLLFPPRCVSCRTSGNLLCKSCFDSIQPPPPPRCRHCSAPLEADSARMLCRNCQRRNSLLTTVHAVSTYRGPLRSAIQALKYEGQTRLAAPLGFLLARELLTHYRTGNIDALIAVPLHPSRQKARGYNHSLLLANFCASLTHIKHIQGCLIRSKPTSAQVGLNVAERQQNVEGAFTCVAAEAKKLAGLNILLIDDVYTTGATLEACARTLRMAGVKSVGGLALACSGPQLFETSSKGIITENSADR